MRRPFLLLLAMCLLCASGCATPESFMETFFGGRNSNEAYLSQFNHGANVVISEK
jgi:hypothetical protein